MNDEIRMIQNDEEEEEIDLVELFFALLEHWAFILITSIITAGIVAAVNFLILVPQFESTAQLYVLDSSTTISSLTDIQIGNNMMDDYLDVLSSRPVLDTVIENLSLEEDYKDLGNKLTVSNDNDTHIISITVKDPNASRAKMIADEIAKVGKSFIADKMGQKEPSVLHYGYADGDKVSPRRLRNTIIGGAAGFLCSCGLVIVLHLLDDKISNEDEVEKYLELNVLGSLPYEDDEEDKKKNKGGK